MWGVKMPILYCITTEDIDGALCHTGFCEFWVGSQREAASKRKLLRNEGRRVIATTRYEVPTRKKDLLIFFNAHFDGA